MVNIPIYIINQNIFNETKHIVDFSASAEWQKIKHKAYIYTNFTLFQPFYYIIGLDTYEVFKAVH